MENGNPMISSIILKGSKWMNDKGIRKNYYHKWNYNICLISKRIRILSYMWENCMNYQILHLLFVVKGKKNYIELYK